MPNNVETSMSVAANACNSFFDLALDKMLRDHEWPEFIRSSPLALLAANERPEWTYAYRLPSASKYFKGIQGTECHGYQDYTYNYYRRNLTLRVATIPFELGSDRDGGVVYTDQAQAIGRYILLKTPAEWNADFKLAFSLLLASYIAPQVTGGDQFKLGQAAYQRYQVDVKLAAANSYNERDLGQTPMSRLEAVR